MIHVYSLGYMRNDPGKSRYFAALSFEKQGHLPQAFEQYQAVLKANPGDELAALAGFRSGVVLAGQKKFGDARAAFARLPLLRLRWFDGSSRSLRRSRHGPAPCPT